MAQFVIGRFGMTTHTLKTWPVFFEAILDGSKSFEIRSTDDRFFEIGDVLILQEWIPETSFYTGRLIMKKVTFVMSGFGLKDEFVALGLHSFDGVDDIT